MNHRFSASAESEHGDWTEESALHGEGISGDSHDRSPELVHGQDPLFPRTRNGLPSEQSALMSQSYRPPSTPQQETNPNHSLPDQGKGQISQQWSIKKKMFLAVVVLMFILACCGLVTLGVVKCWLPRSNVANVTRVISENHTVGLGNLPYDSVNITALDPNQYHHTVDIYQLHCGAITNRTYHSFACDSTPLVVSHFSLDNFLYLVAGSVVEYVVSVISAPRYSVMKIFLFNNKEDSDSFINSETVPHALFNQSLTVRENGTTFPPVSFPVTADTYVYPAASVSAPMNLTICNNYTMVEYNIPQMYAENCTIQSSSDSCNFTLGADTCLFAYTHVKGPEQTSQASLIVQGTREATTPEYCVGVEVGLGLIIALLIILIIFALICRYKHTCTMSGKRCSDTSHGGTAPDTYAYTGNNETAYQSIQY